jgi:hypothetical protein
MQASCPQQQMHRRTSLLVQAEAASDSRAYQHQHLYPAPPPTTPSTHLLLVPRHLPSEAVPHKGGEPRQQQGFMARAVRGAALRQIPHHVWVQRAQQQPLEACRYAGVKLRGGGAGMGGISARQQCGSEGWEHKHWEAFGVGQVEGGQLAGAAGMLAWHGSTSSALLVPFLPQATAEHMQD